MKEQIERMIDLGLIRSARQIAPDAWAILGPCDFLKLARELSITERGQWYPRDTGITWLCGKWRAWLIEEDALPQVKEARDLVKRFNLRCGWSTGSAANSLLKWAVEPQQWQRGSDCLLSGIEYAYHDCTPGLYEHLRLWDVSACYYTLATRLPSPRMVPTSRRLLWHPLSDRERGRWDTMLGELGGIKLLRNSLIGCMVGGRDPILYFCKGVAKYVRRSGGPLRAAGLLIVRSAFELCQQAAAEVSSVYSQTDCVATAGEIAPAAWANVGLETRLQAEGRAEICGRGIYTIGEKQTYWYKEGSRLQLPAPPPPPPPLLYSSLWL